MPKAAYRRENRFLRDTARLISDARDADVMLQTLDGLSERFVGRLPERSFRELRDRLAASVSVSTRRNPRPTAAAFGPTWRPLAVTSRSRGLRKQLQEDGG